MDLIGAKRWTCGTWGYIGRAGEVPPGMVFIWGLVLFEFIGYQKILRGHTKDRDKQLTQPMKYGYVTTGKTKCVALKVQYKQKCPTDDSRYHNKLKQSSMYMKLMDKQILFQ